MGFGVLFSGYFLMLNFAYSDFSDAIAGILMLYALYKLSFLNRNMKLASYLAAAFTVFGIYELGIAVCEMFYIIEESILLHSITAILRNCIVFALTLLMLTGMRDVAHEVKLKSLAVRCERLTYPTLIIYSLLILLECGQLAEFIDVRILAYISVLLIFSELVLIILNLVTVFRCYARICMPSEQRSGGERKSRFAFINAMREHQEAKAKEYADYKLERLKQKTQKAKEGKNDGSKGK